MQPNNSILDINDLKKVWRLFSRNWLLIGLFSLGSFIAYLIYFHFQTNYTAATTQIALKYNPNNKKEYSDYSEEMIGIKSYDLIEKTIDSLHLNISYYIGKEPNITEVYNGLPFQLEVKAINGDLYEQLIKVKIANVNELELTYIKSGNNITGYLPFDSLFTSNDFQVSVHKNNSINEGTIETLKNVNYLVQFHDKEKQVADYQSAMKIDMTGDLAILKVTLQDLIPARAVSFLDALSKRFLDNTVKAQIDLNKKTLAGIDKQLLGTSGILKEVQTKLKQYEEENGGIKLDLNQNKLSLTEQIKGYKDEKEGLEAHLTTLIDLERYIIEDKENDVLPPAFYNNNDDAFLNNSTIELYNLQVNRKGLLFSATENSVSIQAADFKINLLKKNLLTYINNNRVALQSKINKSTTTLASFEGHEKDFTQKQIETSDLQRQLSVNERMYMALLEKRNNTIIAQAGIVPEYKIIERSRPYSIAKSFSWILLLKFLGVGLVLSFIVVYIGILFYERVETFEDLKAKTHLPIIGETPYMTNGKVKREFMFHAHTESLLSESLRLIRGHLEYIPSQDKKGKVILLTSHNPGEGKTFNTVNLGAILANSGKKVLILDYDLHKPNIQKALGLPPDDIIGISTILNHKIGIEGCIKKTDIANLEVILSGSIDKKASELIINNKTQEIIEFGKTNYDYVLVDTPPVGLISDALTLMRFADNTLFVINTKFYSRSSIRQAHDIVANNDKLKISFILNGVNPKRLRYSSSYSYNNYITKIAS